MCTLLYAPLWFFTHCISTVFYTLREMKLHFFNVRFSLPIPVFNDLFAGNNSSAVKLKTRKQDFHFGLALYNTKTVSGFASKKTKYVLIHQVSNPGLT